MIDVVSLPKKIEKKIDEKVLEKICKELDVKIKKDEDYYIIEGEPYNILRVKLIFQALGKNFEIEDAMLLSSDEYFFETLNIKEFTRSRNRIIQLKGRIIGKKGKVRKRIEELTNTKISVYGNTVSIIGKYEDILLAKKAIEMLLEGRKHSTVFFFLEKEISKRKTTTF
jgi:ribosomal RNA assembly protein